MKSLLVNSQVPADSVYPIKSALSTRFKSVRFAVASAMTSVWIQNQGFELKLRAMNNSPILSTEREYRLLNACFEDL